MTPAEAQALADGIVERSLPGEQLEAVVSWARSTEVRAHGGDLEHLVSAEEFGVGVRVIKDGKQGLSWAGVLDEAELERCVSEARDNSEFGTPDPNAGLAQPDSVVPQQLDLVDHALVNVPTIDKVEIALELDRAITAADKRVVGHEGADYGDGMGVSAISSTEGIRAAEEETSTFLGTYALASDGSDTTTGFGMSVGRGFGDLNVDSTVDEAVERAVSLLGARKAPSRRTTVILDPYVCSQFLGILGDMLSAEEVLRGRSPFAARVGEEIASPLLTLTDDPLCVEAPTASGVDGEGLACRPLTLISAGVLNGFLHNAYTARSMGTRSTGSASRASHHSAPGVAPKVLGVRAGRLKPSEILAEVGDGLLVHELAGLHSGVNPVSGDMSVGAEGVIVRGGELAEPVREITIASTLQRMLTDVVAVGEDLRFFPWESSGVTLAIADMTMSGS